MSTGETWCHGMKAKREKREKRAFTGITGVTGDIGETGPAPTVMAVDGGVEITSGETTVTINDGEDATSSEDLPLDIWREVSNGFTW